MKASDRQRDNIIRATLSLVEARGMVSVSLSDIAAEAGVSRQTVYNHFPDVAAVIEAALHMHGSAMVAHLEGLMAAVDTPREKMLAAARFMIDMADPGHAALPLEAGLSPEARARLDRHAEAIRDHVATVLGPDVAPVRADLVWSLIEAAAQSAARHPEAKADILAVLTAALDAALKHQPGRFA